MNEVSINILFYKCETQGKNMSCQVYAIRKLWSPDYLTPEFVFFPLFYTVSDNNGHQFCASYVD